MELTSGYAIAPLREGSSFDRCQVTLQSTREADQRLNPAIDRVRHPRS